MAQVRLVHVSKRFGDVAAVDDITLEVLDREFLVLVGPSGCGKTTTLRMVAGLEDASAGEIYIGDRLVNQVEPKDRDIAMVFQNYALYPHMTVYDNMAFGLKLRRLPRAEIDQRVRDAADVLGIGELLRRRPKELSGGQRQRVALGRAIVRSPSVFLMDEPLSNLDAQLRVQMRAEISKLHQRVATTFIYVTHDQVEAMTMGQRIVVMKDGLIQQIAEPQDLYDHPRNRFVASFIGSPAMNFLPAVAEAGGLRLSGLRLELALPDVAPGRQVDVGVRPEDLALEAGRPGWQLPTVVEVVEPLGAEQYLHLSSEAGPLTARVSPELRLRPGERVAVTLNPGKLHVFDGETGLRVPPTGPR
ncbi:MAG TPA: sn-glycerol-3-phosphate ABC transporter ATP-binding protein UgpC [Bacillota bacterium]|nr:sn-glycerol-3-phosphate ABC transporter ATP-binding protein UgpC [Bacillota bacterium]